MERVASRKALLYILHAPTGMDERILANNRRGIADDCKLLDFFSVIPWCLYRNSGEARAEKSTSHRNESK